MKNREDWTEEDLSYWKTKGFWYCAVPRDDFATQNGFSWKEFGLIGRGKTKEEAKHDWKSWKEAADFVLDIC